MDPSTRQRIRYLRTSDGVQLAWAEAGKGPLLVKAANWLKTFRNHLSHLFDKLGVWTRAQAIVFAHDHGLRS
jgi:hypothetical protein